jgi:hypothetical protein
MIEVKEKTIELINTTELKVELGDYLKTYVDQYNSMVSTYEWMKVKLDWRQQQLWESTIASLKTVCCALDAGFEPTTPPRNWSSGLLIQYVAPIPEEVRKSIDKAEAIFGRQQILIYDPNTEHFQRPKVIDPIVVGFVTLADERLNFLVGQWDLKDDLKFIKGEKPERTVRRTQEQISQFIDLTRQILPSAPPTWQPQITTEQFSPVSMPYINGSVWGTPAGETNVNYVSHNDVPTTGDVSHFSRWSSKMLTPDLVNTLSNLLK